MARFCGTDTPCFPVETPPRRARRRAPGADSPSVSPCHGWQLRPPDLGPTGPLGDRRDTLSTPDANVYI